MAMSAAPGPMSFAPMPPMPGRPDASGANALGNITNLALAMQSRLGQPQPMGGAGAAMGGAMGGGPTDAPPRRKTPFTQAASYA